MRRRSYDGAEEMVMAGRKLHPADRLLIQVLLLVLGVAAVPVVLLAVLWVASRITGGGW